MDLNLKDKHVLITGGSKGIGLACAAAFLQEGARVTLVARQAQTLDSAMRKLLEQTPLAVVHVCAADLTDAGQAAGALAQALKPYTWLPQARFKAHGVPPGGSAQLAQGTLAYGTRPRAPLQCAWGPLAGCCGTAPRARSGDGHWQSGGL